MKNEIKVIGKQEFMGREIPVIIGGFGGDNKVITAKEVANIHEVELKTINQSIKRLIDKNRIKVGVHYIDLLSNENFKVTASDLGLITSNGQKNCFILSERGYCKLIKYMDDDESWDVMDKLIDEYFRMKEVIKSDEQLKKELLLKLYNGGIDSVEAHKQLSALETKHLTEKIETMQPSVDMAQKRRASDGLYTYTDCQKKFGLKQGQVGSYLKVKGFVHWDKKETTKLGDDTGFVRQYGEEFPNIGVTELGLKFLEDNLDELKSTPCKLPKRKQDWIDENN